MLRARDDRRNAVEIERAEFTFVALTRYVSPSVKLWY